MVFFLSKIEKFEIVFFSMLCVDKVFGDVLNSIQSTLEEKNVHLWMPKKLTFSKWINPGILSKNENFETASFWEKQV